MCEKQTLVSHSSTDSEVISLDAGLRMDGLPPLDLSDLVIEVLHYSSIQSSIHGNLCRNEQSRKRSNTKMKKHINGDDIELFNVDHVTTNAKPSHVGALLHIFEDKAVIKMIVQGRKSHSETCVPYPQSHA